MRSYHFHMQLWTWQLPLEGSQTSNSWPKGLDSVYTDSISSSTAKPQSPLDKKLQFLMSSLEKSSASLSSRSSSSSLSSISIHEVDPLLKDLNEKKQSFRRNVVSLAAELKEVRSRLASQEQSYAKESLTRQACGLQIMGSFCILCLVWGLEVNHFSFWSFSFVGVIWVYMIIKTEYFRGLFFSGSRGKG